MILLSFLFIFTGLCTVVTGVLLLTLHIANTGTWPGFQPQNWDIRFKKVILLSGAGILISFIGVLAGYGI